MTGQGSSWGKSWVVISYIVAKVVSRTLAVCPSVEWGRRSRLHIRGRRTRRPFHAASINQTPTERKKNGAWWRGKGRKKKKEEKRYSNEDRATRKQGSPSQRQ